QWCEVSAEGTLAASPPSNPGAEGQSPVGGAGISQTFGYPDGTPLLQFDAAFLRAGPPDMALYNDWMSVDVTDGATTCNVFYADTFSPTPSISTRYGLPMTPVATVTADLQLLFPFSTCSTRFTVTVEVGNGGDGLAPSRGYVDHFRFLPPTAAL